MSDSRAYAQYYWDCLQVIEDHGWMLQGVFPTVDQPEGLDFTYTVGLSAKGLPELYISGLGRQGGDILNRMAERMTDTTRHVPVAGELVDVEYSVPFKLRGPISFSDAEMFLAQRFATVEGHGLTCLQVLWPDDEEHFPGDDGYDQSKFEQYLPHLQLP